MKKKQIMIIGISIAALVLSFFFDHFLTRAIEDVQNPLIYFLFDVGGHVITILLVLFIVPLYLTKKKKAVPLFVVILITSLVVGMILKEVIGRDRPFDIMFIPFLHIVDYSFPSLHTLISFSLATVAARFVPRYQAYWYGYALFVGVSRVYLEAHYLSDVIAGALIGYLIADAVIALWRN